MDDISLSTRLEKQLNFLNKKNLKVCTTRAITKIHLKKYPDCLFMFQKIIIRFKNPFIHGTLLIEKSLLNKMGNYDENFYYAQDYKLFSKLLKNKYSLKIMKESLYVQTL